MNNILPLTKGLLVSMAKRADHAYGFDLPEEYIGHPIWSHCGHTNKSRILLIEEMKDWHKKFSQPDYKVPAWAGETITELQLFEEASGKGFYRSDLEDNYAKGYPVYQDESKS